MTSWFRFYGETLNDPKILKLSDNLYRVWVGLLCVASKNNGRLPPLDDLSLLLRMTPAKIRAAVDSLMKSGLFDEIDTDIVPHNWNARQYKSDVSTERVKRFRNGKRNVSVTPPETESTDNTDTEKKETREVALLPAANFDEFWSLFPNKVGKPAALKAFRSASKRASFEEIREGVWAYVRDKPPDRPWLMPATFLNQDRWKDQPAQVQNGTAKNKPNVVDVAKRWAEHFESQSGDGGPRDTGVVLRLSSG